MQVNLPGKGVQYEIPCITKEGNERILRATVQGRDTAKGITLARWVEQNVVLNVRTMERETAKTGTDLERIDRNEGVFVVAVESGPAKETYRGCRSGVGGRGSWRRFIAVFLWRGSRTCQTHH